MQLEREGIFMEDTAWYCCYDHYCLTLRSNVDFLVQRPLHSTLVLKSLYYIISGLYTGPSGYSGVALGRFTGLWNSNGL